MEQALAPEKVMADLEALGTKLAGGEKNSERQRVSKALAECNVTAQAFELRKAVSHGWPGEVWVSREKCLPNRVKRTDQLYTYVFIRSAYIPYLQADAGNLIACVQFLFTHTDFCTWPSILTTGTHARGCWRKIHVLALCSHITFRSPNP